MSRCRNEKIQSPWRNSTVEENLNRFKLMKNGYYAEGECCLRAKMDMSDAWCIYPTYDYTQCLVDSLENITHSLCTLEFEIRREPYYWFLKNLDMYKPFVWEFSRLNMSNTVLSKRKIE